jgi:hypothetical protein
VEERRGGHIGAISGLALLTGATALAAVAGGRHSIFATLLWRTRPRAPCSSPSAAEQ